MQEKLFKGWKAYANWHSKLNKKALKFRKKLERQAKEKYFVSWNQLFNEIYSEREQTMKAMMFYKMRAYMSCFKKLLKYKELQQTKKFNIQHANRYSNERVVVKVFMSWLKFHSKISALKKKQEKYLKKKNRETAKLYFAEWRQELKTTIKVNEIHNSFLLHRVMAALKKNRDNNKTVLEKVQTFGENMELEFLSKAFDAFCNVVQAKLRRKKKLNKFRENRNYYIASMCFLKLLEYAKKTSKLRRREVAFTKERRDRLLTGVVHEWANVVIKRRKDRLIGYQLTGKKELKLISGAFGLWRKLFLLAVEEKKHEDSYIAKMQKKRVRKIFYFLKKEQEKTKQKLRIARDSMFLKVASKSFKILKSRALKKKSRKTKLHQLLQKKERTLIGNIFGVLKQKTLKNKSKRLQRIKANNFYNKILLKRSFNRLANNRQTESFFSKNKKKIESVRAKKFLAIWREQLKYSHARKLMFLKYKKRTLIKIMQALKWNKERNYRIYRFQQKYAVLLLRKIMKVFKERQVMKAKKQSLVQLQKKFEIGHIKRLCWDIWMHEFTLSRHANLRADNFIARRQASLQKLFLDILSIKRQKKLLRGILLKRFAIISREINLKKWFNLFAEAVFTVKAFKKAQHEYTLKKKQYIVSQYFEKMKEYHEFQKQKTERALQYSDRVRENLLHAIMASWKDYTAKRVKRRALKSQVDQMVNEGLKQKYFRKYFFLIKLLTSLG